MSVNSRSISAASGRRASRAASAPGLELGVAIGVGLDDLRVHAQRGVVDEHALVDAGEVDPPLEPVAERVRRADDVVAVGAGVEREVVARARRYAHVGHTRRAAALVATSACDPSPPAIPITCEPPAALGQLRQVVPGFQHDRLDAAAFGLGDEVEALGAAPDFRLMMRTGRCSSAYRRRGSRDRLAGSAPTPSAAGAASERREQQRERPARSLLASGWPDDHESGRRQHGDRSRDQAEYARAS